MVSTFQGRSSLQRGLLGLLMLLTACSWFGEDGDEVVAAYVPLADTAVETDELLQAVTKAGPGEPAEPAGLVEGVMGVFRVVDPRSGFGVRVIFHRDASDAQRAAFVSRAEELGLEPVLLRRDDVWPNCVPQSDCERVGDSPALPN